MLVADRPPAARRGPRFVVFRRPFRTGDRLEGALDAGQTIAEGLEAAGLLAGDYVVEIDGREVPREAWTTRRLRDGENLVVRVRIRGGGGDGGGKGILRIVAMLAILVITVLTGGLAAPLLGIAEAGTATAIAVDLAIGNLLVAALIPPSMPEQPNAASYGGAQNSITGTRNAIARYGVVPMVFGKRRLFPPHAATPFREIVGKAEYVVMLFAIAGEYAISSVRLGETPIITDGAIAYSGKVTGDGAFGGVTMEFRKGLPGDEAISLYPDTVKEDGIGVELMGAKATPKGSWLTDGLPSATFDESNFRWVRRTSGRDATRLAVEFNCAAGLGWLSDTSSKIKEIAAKVLIRYRSVGATTWTYRKMLVVKGAQRTAKTFGDLWDVTKGQYEVETARWFDRGTDQNVLDRIWWTKLSTVLVGSPPVVASGLTKIVVRIKRTNQLNGTPDDLNLVASRILLDYDHTDGTWKKRESASPASAYRAILQGDGNKRPVADGSLDLDRIEAFHDECRLAGREFNIAWSDGGTVFARCGVALAAGRGSFSIRDGRFSVVSDTTRTAVAQTFGIRNSRRVRGSLVFADRLHALRVTFDDREEDWQENACIVYDDGYSKSGGGGTVAATRFEEMRLDGVTSWNEAWKLGRYYLAVMRLRREVVELEADFEASLVERGDLVRVNCDVPRWGESSGRVTAVEINGSGQATGFSCEPLAPMDVVSGQRYAARFRRDDGSNVIGTTEATTTGLVVSFTFETPIAAASVPQVGNLFLWGKVDEESRPMIVKSFHPASALAARLVLLDEAPAVLTADSGTPPPREPISGTADLNPPQEESVAIESASSTTDETDPQSEDEDDAPTSSTPTSGTSGSGNSTTSTSSGTKPSGGKGGNGGKGGKKKPKIHVETKKHGGKGK